MPLRTLVVIPTVDESTNIVDVLTRVRAVVPDADVLVVDGASSDDTVALAEGVARDLGGVEVLEQAVRNGLGGAYRSGFERGLGDGYEVLVEMDADLSHDPTALPSLIGAVSDGARLAIGSRYVPGGATPDWTRGRRWLSRWANRYSNTLLGLRVRDSTAGFRAYRSDTLRDIDYGTTRADGYGFQIEMTNRVVRTGGGIVELPIVFHDRSRGTSKMSSRIVVEAVVLVAVWAVRDRVLRRGWPRSTP